MWRLIRWIVLACLLSVAPCIVQAQDISINPGFEQHDSTTVRGWQGFEKGYVPDALVFHGGQASLRCVNTDADEKRGACLHLTLNQSEPQPIQVSAWSRAQDVSGLPNSDYSLYIDATYTDGSTLWGIEEPFDTGNHGWQKRVLLITPTKPLREMMVYVLLRNHTGTAWFDDVKVTLIPPSRTFDGQLISPPGLSKGQTQAWFARDVAANSSVLPPERLGLKVVVNSSGSTTHAVVEDTTGKERAITLYYVRLFPVTNGIWWNDLDESQRVRNREWGNFIQVGEGATGAMSQYPFACVTGDGKGEAVGVPPRLGPRICRLGYHGGSQLFYVAFDLALTNKNATGKRTADAAVVTWKVDPRWGFRDAAAGYYGLFPVVFARRATAEGIWMPFTDPAKVQNAADFGFAYHEGDNSVVSDDTQNILSFRYTEPHSYWMVIPPAVPRTYENALAQLKREAAGKEGEPWRQRAARAVLQSGTQNQKGEFNGHFENAPWANGIVWLLNANPAIPGEDTKARINYTPEEADQRFMPGPKGSLDGEYLDSVEAWADTQDFRTSNFRASTVPLTFTTADLQPVLPLWFSLYEFIRWEADDLHRRGKLLFGNSLPIRYFALTTNFDVMGIETNWIDGDHWRPEDESIFRLRRTLCYQKPYLLLMNTDFSKMTPERVESYFQRCMAWAVYPSMFSVNAADSPYWENPKWYNRDRDLFKKYVPAIKRLSAAGWQPVPYARSRNVDVRIERFGTKLFTVRNTTDTAITTKLSFNSNRLGWETGLLSAKDIVNGTALGTVSGNSRAELTVMVPAQGVIALEIVRSE
jgi:hypothetical protein